MAATSDPDTDWPTRRSTDRGSAGVGMLHPTVVPENFERTERSRER